ncbi:hypothetical protein ABTC69_17880 [Acinetobacter baumannii]
MSEFKVGDKVVAISNELNGRIRVVKEIIDGKYLVFKHDGFHKNLFRKAESAEEEAGHRIESSNDQAISDCSVSNLCQNDTQNSLPIKQENQDMGDDSHIENHISPLCKTIGDQS